MASLSLEGRVGAAGYKVVEVLPFEGSCHLAVGRAVAQHNLSHITTVLQDQKFRCQLIDSSEDLSMVSIQGPASQAILQEGMDTHLSNEAFPFSTHKFLRASRHLVRATWLSFTGELGWGLHIPKVSCMPVYQAVMATGAKHDLVNAGHHAIDSLSIEKEHLQVPLHPRTGWALQHSYFPFLATRLAAVTTTSADVNTTTVALKAPTPTRLLPPSPCRCPPTTPHPTALVELQSLSLPPTT
ncbi:sarcosine dehydrogenase, mitochondrial-like [Macaca nemestrina]|uniref:sarcosine dehydrogenase, mitochondrial-like n=1 Tax=Macaca nemestrina TaxID=9545 RepID=UPI0039B8A052